MSESKMNSNSDKGNEGEKNRGEAESLFEEGRRLHAEEKFDKAKKCFEMAGELGHIGALYNLGCYLSKEDAVKAAECYEKAAKLGHAEAQNNLGVCYELGTGVPKDVVLAAQWYRKAADQGNQSAMEVSLTATVP